MIKLWKYRLFRITLIIFIVPFLIWAGLQPMTSKGAETATSVRRVNVPYLQELPFEPGIFWFGEVDPNHNYTDVRVWYYEEYLIVVFHVIDRLHWVDPSGNAANLANWDAVSLYFNLNGNNGTVPTSTSYRLDAQLSGLQAVYRGNGASWQMVPFDFEAEPVWRGDQGPNSSVDGKGWQITFSIPFSSFGLSQKPAEGTIWGLSAISHDRDDLDGTNLYHTIWPETMNPNNPSSWGQMHFGRAIYESPTVTSSGEYIIRNGKDGMEVVDAAVGGHTVCGDNLDHWTEWGDANYAGYSQFNIQNQWDISDWPCFSKYFVTFPLDILPPGKVVVSGLLSMTLFGNSGGGEWGTPPDSYIQVLTVGSDWDESTLSWNNAPLAVENIAGSWVYPRDYSLPDQTYHWDISKAVQQAYEAGQPLRLAIYSIDGEMHSGKYFWSSDTYDWNADQIPQLKVVLGDLSPETNLEVAADPTIATNGTDILFSLSWNGIREDITLVDQIPAGFSTPTDLQASSGIVNYDSNTRKIQWSGSPLEGQNVALSFRTTVLVDGPRALISSVNLSDNNGILENQNIVIFVDPLQNFLPLIFH
jgi:hypothetical protein